MRKIFFTALGICIAFNNFAQDAAEKKVQAGLSTGLGISIQKMGTKNIATNGVGSDLTIGSNVIYGFNDNIAICTGVEFDFSTLKYKSNTATPTYYRYKDTEILEQEESTAADQMYLLISRKQKGVYITIPTMMVFRTNFIGYFRYFGKFGLRNSFLLTSKINDTGFNYDPATEVSTSFDNEGMKSPGDMFFFKSAVGLAGGAEWNFTGSTCLVAEFGYYFGITPLHVTNKEKNMTLFNTDDNLGLGNDVYFSNKATQSQLMLKVSILF